MNLETIIKIKNDINLYRYLRENSYWYKLLNRNPDNIKLMEEEMKRKYKLNLTDRINNLTDKINTIKNLIDILK